MSAKGLEYYPTPKWAIRSFLNHPSVNLQALAYENPEPLILDPCAGDGRITRVLAELLAPAVTVRRCDVDIDPRADNVIQQDWLAGPNLKVYMAQRADLAIFNPPFSRAIEFFHKTRPLANRIALLQRLNWLGSMARHEFWRNNAPDALFVYSKRPSFTGKGTDSQEYAWFVWDYDLNPFVDRGIFVLKE